MLGELPQQRGEFRHRIKRRSPRWQLLAECRTCCCPGTQCAMRRIKGCLETDLASPCVPSRKRRHACKSQLRIFRKAMLTTVSNKAPHVQPIYVYRALLETTILAPDLLNGRIAPEFECSHSAPLPNFTHAPTIQTLDDSRRYNLLWTEEFIRSAARSISFYCSRTATSFLIKIGSGY